MKVNRQTCQACNSIDVRNILVRETNHPSVVYVRCANCRELVACYQLSDYYHHGKGLDSYLRGHGVEAGDSGREWLAAFKRAQNQAVSGYESALQHLSEDHKQV